MLIAPLPSDEATRLLTLHALRVLDTPPDDVLDGIASVASDIIGCPISLVSFVDTDRQWFKARNGLALAQTSRDVAFCAHAILGDAIFEVNDASTDPRFANNPLVVGEPHIRFYAGVPLVIDRQRIGTLCILDRRPRRLNHRKRKVLRDLGRAVEQWIVGWRQSNLLADAERDRRTLVEQLGDGVLLLDARQCIVEANAPACAMLGYERDELTGRPVAELLVARQEQDPDGHLTERSQAHLQVIRRDGCVLAINASLKRTGDSGYVTILRDLAPPAFHEARLRQLLPAVEQSVECIVVTGVDGEIEYANARTAELLGIPLDEVVGRPFDAVLSIGDTHAQRLVSQALRDGQPAKAPLTTRCSDGSLRHHVAVWTPIREDDGRVTHFVLVMEDVTEQRATAAELARHRDHVDDLVADRTRELTAARQAAELVSSTRQEWLTTLSHEIRTPMNGVIGMIELLRQSSLTPYQMELSETVLESSCGLVDSMEDILDFSRIEAGHVGVARESHSLMRLCESICDGQQAVAAARNVGLQLFVDPGLPDYVWTDATRLRQILNNLVGNAIKFSASDEKRGKVGVELERGDDGQLRITVSDNGIGIAEDAKARIFEPFMQADASTTRRFGGTGLGLSICRRLVTMFGGDIGVSSVVGQGASFVVTLPLEVDETRLDARHEALRNVDCHVLFDDARWLAHWCAYLASAGARTFPWLTAVALRSGLLPSPGRECVVVIGTESADAELLDWIGAPDRGEPLACVRMTRGRRRAPRPVSPQRVSLDGDALRRGTLVDAVALAAGRTEALSDPQSRIESVRLPPLVCADGVAGRMPVLVAEGDPTNQKVMRRQLSLLGLECEVVADGLVALARWRTGRFAMLLTDLRMSGLDGFELTAAIRDAETPGRRIPIIAVTATAGEGESEQCAMVGMDAYLSKPIRLEQLRSTLQRWLPRDACKPVLECAGTESRELDGLLEYGENVAPLPRFRADFSRLARQGSRDLHAGIYAGEWTRVAATARRLALASRAAESIALAECCATLAWIAEEQVFDGLDAAVLAFDAVLLRHVAALDFPEPELSNVGDGELSIIVIDDEPMHLQVVKQQQRSTSKPVRVVICRSPLHALQCVSGQNTTKVLILFDLDMPGMDGIEFMRRLVELRFDGTIALTSGADGRVVEASLKVAGAYRLNVLGHLRKPAASAPLASLVERWLLFTPTRDDRHAKRYSADDVRDAIESGALLLHYQPKVSLQTGALVGVEALVRWQHPVDGLVYPDAFIAVAETHGLIDDLTRWVLTAALAQTRRWLDRGLLLRTAINISMDNLTRVDFVEFLMDEIARHGLHAADVILEITESRVMQDVVIPLDILTRLRLKRVRLAIDDFGTGHSSLAQLRDIPFDELKIDRSCVHGSRTHPTESAIFTASLAMAHQLGMEAVAEGVEDQADWDYAKAAGCDVAQGYFIARPMLPEALTDWASRRTATLPEVV